MIFVYHILTKLSLYEVNGLDRFLRPVKVTCKHCLCLQVLVGGYGLSDNAQRSQMAMWAMFSAPLLMSNDLRAMPDKAKQLAQNKLLISVNQDPLGKMATKLWEVIL